MLFSSKSSRQFWQQAHIISLTQTQAQHLLIAGSKSVEILKLSVKLLFLFTQCMTHYFTKLLVMKLNISNYCFVNNKCPLNKCKSSFEEHIRSVIEKK